MKGKYQVFLESYLRNLTQWDPKIRYLYFIRWVWNNLIQLSEIYYSSKPVKLNKILATKDQKRWTRNISSSGEIHQTLSIFQFYILAIFWLWRFLHKSEDLNLEPQLCNNLQRKTPTEEKTPKTTKLSKHQLFETKCIINKPRRLRLKLCEKDSTRRIRSYYV